MIFFTRVVLFVSTLFFLFITVIIVVMRKGTVNMAKVLGFWNRKGGVGKTHGVYNVGAALALAGKKVLLVDGDSQINLTYRVFGNEEAVYADGGATYKEDNLVTLVDVISNPETINDAVLTAFFEAKRKTQDREDIHTLSCELDLLPGSRMLDFVDPPSVDCLKKAISLLSDNYDLIILDFPPSSSKYTDCFLCACDYIITPVVINEDESLSGYMAVQEMVGATIAGGLNKNLRLLGMYYTKVQEYKPMHKDSLMDSKTMKDEWMIMESYIRMDERYKDSSHFKFMPLCIDVPRRPITLDYQNLANEIVTKF